MVFMSMKMDDVVKKVFAEIKDNKRRCSDRLGTNIWSRSNRKSQTSDYHGDTLYKRRNCESVAEVHFNLQTKVLAQPAFATFLTECKVNSIHCLNYICVVEVMIYCHCQTLVSYHQLRIFTEKIRQYNYMNIWNSRQFQHDSPSRKYLVKGTLAIMH